MAKIMWTHDKFKIMVVNREPALLLLLQQFLFFLEGFPLNVGTWLWRFATIYTISEALQFIPNMFVYGWNNQTQKYYIKGSVHIFFGHAVYVDVSAIKTN